jgi:hypothetical protein
LNDGLHAQGAPDADPGTAAAIALAARLSLDYGQRIPLVAIAVLIWCAVASKKHP